MPRPHFCELRPKVLELLMHLEVALVPRTQPDSRCALRLHMINEGPAKSCSTQASHGLARHQPVSICSRILQCNIPLGTETLDGHAIVRFSG